VSLALPPAVPARDRLRHYLPLLRGRGPVLVLGPDQRELVELLAADGVKATGIGAGPPGTQAARALAHLDAEPPPGPYRAAFCGRLLDRLQAPDALRLLAGVRGVLAPGCRLVASVANPASYAVLAADAWRDPALVRLYDLSLLAYLSRRAGFQVEDSGGNPATRPDPPAWLRADEPTVHPDLADAIGQALTRLGRGLEHHDRDRPAGEAHDPAFAHNLVHVLKTVADRLAETQDSARRILLAHRALADAMHQPTEVYVVARRSETPPA
jgi:hypothetical protein